MFQHYRKTTDIGDQFNTLKEKIWQKTSTGRTRYQGCGITAEREFNGGPVNLYRRGQGRGFNPTKPKVQGKFEALVIYVYLIGYARQSDNYTKTTEAIINYIQGNFNEGNDVKELLELLNNFDFNIIKPKTIHAITLKGSV